MISPATASSPSKARWRRPKSNLPGHRFEPLFSGKFETGLYPDEWNWRLGRDREDLTRQICNGWKSDLTIASIVLRRDVGEACARLRGWPGARLGQDNVIWKPPGGKPLGFHQDDSYNNWIVPGEMMTCWVSLDDTKAYQGTIEHVQRLASMADLAADQAVPCAGRRAGRSADRGRGGRHRRL